jgi:hypothetical protein
VPRGRVPPVASESSDVALTLATARISAQLRLRTVNGWAFPTIRARFNLASLKTDWVGAGCASKWGAGGSR